MNALTLGLIQRVDGLAVLGAVIKGDLRLADALALRLVLRCQEAITQRLCCAGEWPVEGQQQADVGWATRLQRFDLLDRVGQAIGGGMGCMAFLPDLQRPDLQIQIALIAGNQCQLKPSCEFTAGAVAGRLQCLGFRLGQAVPDCLVVSSLLAWGKQAVNKDALPGCFDILPVGVQYICAQLLNAQLFGQGADVELLKGRVLDCGQCRDAVTQGHRAGGLQLAESNLLVCWQGALRNVLEDAQGLLGIAVVQCGLGGVQAEQVGFGTVMAGGTFQNFFNRGIGCAGQLVQAFRCGSTAGQHCGQCQSQGRQANGAVHARCPYERDWGERPAGRVASLYPSRRAISKVHGTPRAAAVQCVTNCVQEIP